MDLNDVQLKRLQGVCLELVKEIDRVCRKNGIEYTLDGGTLLGAVREKGFLAWDDDADIAMSRENYERFFEACKTDLDKERFFLQEHRTDPEYPWGYSKFRMNGTREVQIGQEHLKMHDGIFIDLFVYDPVPDGWLARRLHHFSCYCVRKCQYAVVGKKNAKNAFLRGWYSLLDKIPKETVFRRLDRLVEKTRNLDTELSSHKTYPYPRKNCKYGLPWKCFKSYIDLPFEDQTFRAMKEYDPYLTMLYGDYMTPPPPSGRKHYPIGVLDFGAESEIQKQRQRNRQI